MMLHADTKVFNVVGQDRKEEPVVEKTFLETGPEGRGVGGESHKGEVREKGHEFLLPVLTARLGRQAGDMIGQSVFDGYGVVVGVLAQREVSQEVLYSSALPRHGWRRRRRIARPWPAAHLVPVRVRAVSVSLEKTRERALKR